MKVPFSDVEPTFSDVECRFSDVERTFNVAERNFLLGKSTFFPNNNQDYFLGNATRGGSSETNGPASPCMGWWMEIAFN